MPYLAVTGGLPPKVFVLNPGAAVVGRSAEADFTLKHVEISRQHCRFTWDGKECRVEDLGSVRGTTVNGKKVATAFTLRSVACADRITAISNWNGLAYSSSVVGCGLASLRRW